LNRSRLYYKSVEKDELYNTIVRRVDEIYTQTPFYGSRKIREVLLREGFIVNRKRIQQIMRTLGLQGITPKKRLSNAYKGHKIYPYILRGVKINEPNHVWSSDITYIRMNKGFLYLTAVIDWFSRTVLSWNLSNSLDTSFCVAALKEALDKYGKPKIFNTDQGVQYTSEQHTSILLENNIEISMDGRGRALDNIFIERFWRSLKYEEVYLKSYSDGDDAYKNISEYIDFYNNERLHQNLGYKTPNEVYQKGGDPMSIEC